MIYRLTCLLGSLAGRGFRLDETITRIGRHASSDIVVSSDFVSSQHCEVRVDGDRVLITDLGSKNGTRVNDVPIDTCEIAPGDQVMVGDARFSLVAVGDVGAGISLVQDPEGGTATVTLQVKENPYLRPESRQSMQAQKWHRALSDLGALCDLARMAAQSQDEDELLRDAVELLFENLGCARAAVLLTDAGTEELRVAATRAAMDRRSDTVVADRALVETVVTQNVSALGWCHGPTDTPKCGLPQEQASEIGPPEADRGRVLCAPISSGEEVLGTLYSARSEEATPFDGDDLNLISAAGYQLGMALEAIRSRERLAMENRSLRRSIDMQDAMKGQSDAMKEVFDAIKRAAPTDETILLRGETGTGKELVAAAIHHNSRRRDKPFVRVNSAAIPETLVESELFGHFKGAFTGADSDKPGLFEQAHEGTIFLDEIGDLSPQAQAKLLRILENGEVKRVGSGEVIYVDVRVVAATNKDLDAAAEAGEFRADLLFRLKVIEIQLPPLRERTGDIPRLAGYFLSQAAADVPRKITGFSAGSMRAFCNYHWPGNVRELKHAVRSAVVMGTSSGTEIEVDDLPSRILLAKPVAAEGDTAELSLDEVQQRHVLRVYRAMKGNIKQTASVLGIGRNTLYSKLRDYGVIE